MRRPPPAAAVVAAAALAGAAAAVVVVRWPHRVAAGVGRLAPDRVLFSVPSRAPILALTFDDGPHPDTTPRLLDVLARHRSRATFFLLGRQAAAHPDLVERITREGHELGNHLMSDAPSIRLPPEEFARQLREAHEILSLHGPVRFFRPGSGWFTPRMLRQASELEYRCALGSVAPLATSHPDPDRVADRLAGRCHPGAIVVLHEGSPDRETVAEVTDGLLERLNAVGLRATTLAELTGLSADREG